MRFLPGVALLFILLAVWCSIASGTPRRALRELRGSSPRNVEEVASEEDTLLVSECLSDGSQVALDLFIVAECPFSLTALSNLFEVVAGLQEVSRGKNVDILASVAPLECNQKETSFVGNSFSPDEVGDKLFCQPSVYDSVPKYVWERRSHELLCFQAVVPQRFVNSNFAAFTKCLYDLKDMDTMKECWREIEPRSPDSHSPSRFCRHGNPDFHRVLVRNHESILSSGVETSPVLIINGKRYCGSYSKKELVAAICAANEKVKSPPLTQGWRPGMLHNRLSRPLQCTPVWWDASAVGSSTEPVEHECLVVHGDPMAEYMPVLLTSFILIASVSFFCLIVSRHRIDALLAQQQREQASANHIRELLQILTLEQTFRQQQSSVRTEATRPRTAADIEEILKSKLELKVYGGKIAPEMNQCGKVYPTSEGGEKEAPELNPSIAASTASEGSDKVAPKLNPSVAVSSTSGASDQSDYSINEERQSVRIQRDEMHRDVNGPYSNSFDETFEEINRAQENGFKDGNAHIDDSCPICLENFRMGDPYYVIDCGHIMHKDCLVQWTTKKNECPMCRNTVVQDLDGDESANETQRLDGNSVGIELQNMQSIRRYQHDLELLQRRYPEIIRSTRSTSSIPAIVLPGTSRPVAIMLPSRSLDLT
mmetsp:Transcript_4702/g.5346  ORF Transcript_4702/g.5346 Transcript_4702/m.5346 type:complete len:653 (+) Transcript_4702:181-2139(+)|eukprot:CAMPEP_0184022434 /NCGR_PEP_ID=MMETSP0954-20121128/10601_1 /TAXON_ID=627963 /ORGANISM="Aplanochytrium sp, Strain PBS07" /LENGTH=652 /DNA_ID=CAMNT_0026304803 /DNA_START=277 /DNA_END=2235 /DNA_ORIENTATION=-